MASEKEKVKVLVTGATGFLASHIVAKLLAEGYPGA
jgi:nucleoside-diphosphate-sugar epimerase